jgi:NADH-quinone oxidoreductase subunit L
MLALIPLFPLLGAIAIPLLRVVTRKPPERAVAGWIASGAVFLSWLVSLWVLWTVIGHHGEPIHQTVYTWIHAGGLRADIGFLADPLAAVMINVVTGVGFLIHVYSIGYMDDEADRTSVWRYFTYLNLFVFAMLLLVLGDNFLLMFVGWEGVGLCSYLLIGFWFENVEFAKAGKKAFVTNRVGDFFFLVGLFWLFWSLGEHKTIDFLELRTLLESRPELVGGIGGATVTGICLLLFGGATGKSAQIPLYVWLPDAMAGPTPVSALIHAATMVTSGIYMICRLNFLFAMSPIAMGVVATIGALTAVFAATIAISQHDIKKVLAYSTVSQLGYMFLGVGVGAYTAGFFHVVTHAFFKALLFLGAGSIIHALHHEQDMRNMGGLRKLMPTTFLVFLMGYLAIIGMPGFSGFFSKDEILWKVATTPPAQIGGLFFLPGMLWGLGTLTAAMTAFYMTRLMILTFGGSYRGGHHGHGHTPHESPSILTVPLIVLAILSVFGGLLNLPHWVPLLPHGKLDHFLEPVFSSAPVMFIQRSDTTELIFMGATLVAILLGLALAWLMYVGDQAWRSDFKHEYEGLWQGSLHKWWIDELYEAVLIRPIVWVSRNVLFAIVDVHVIDGIVNGAAAAMKKVALWNGRTIQGGRVQGYALVIASGTAVLLLVYAVGS